MKRCVSFLINKIKEKMIVYTNQFAPRQTIQTIQVIQTISSLVRVSKTTHARHNAKHVVVGSVDVYLSGATVGDGGGC